MKVFFEGIKAMFDGTLTKHIFCDYDSEENDKRDEKEEADLFIDSDKTFNRNALAWML